MAYPSKKIESRYLPERSYLYYQYPTGKSSVLLEYYLPLLENVEISESQKPNLGSYDLLGRAGTLYSYHGAKSRDFTLTFNITLPNILDYITNVGLNTLFSTTFRNTFLFGTSGKNLFSIEKYTKALFDSTSLKNAYQREKDYFESLKPVEPPSTALDILRSVEKLGSEFSNFLNEFLNIKNRDTTPPKTIIDAVNYMILMVNVIRTSTLNNSSNTSLGPPTIYINHGTMYNNVPCICTNYSIKIVTQNGYDLTSMTPRQIQISLNLSENRVGDFGAFKPFKFIEGENAAGWEAVVDYGTLDPYNSRQSKDLY
jgi:hypothetical protein